MRIKPKALVAATTAFAGLLASAAVLSAVPAQAAPSNAPNLSTGTADCGAAGTYTFVANGNNGQGTSWNVAFITAANGSRAVFHPDSFALTFSSPDGTFMQNVTKNKGPGPVSCHIAGHPINFPQATLAGMVTGTITAQG